ncbi:MAPEG family protein [Novosphingobium sp. M1R2S20]|uniref:MAPEG family protein n=1 Tax=Novosphingobium rhizovicinum TaxID=3228928 RepID=A0ABV3RCL7_9SPHN
MLYNQTLIFLPVLVVVALTLVAFVRMAMGRAAAVKAGHDPAYYRAHHGAPEPESAAAGARHWDNLFELPTLFYAGSLTAFVLGAVSGWTLVFAWGYAAARVVQSAVHMTYNNPGHRGLAFVVGVLFVFALWINVALAVFAGL